MVGGAVPSAGTPEGGKAEVVDLYGILTPVALALFAFWASSRVPTGTVGFWLFDAIPVPTQFSQVTSAGVFLVLCGIALLAFGGGVAWHRQKISDPRDFYGGLALVGLGLFALWASRDLPGMHGFAFGPGTAPRLFAGILIVLGLVVAAVGFFMQGAALERYAIRGPVLLTASVVLFAALIRPVGLVIATYLSIVVCAWGTTEVRWLETLIWGAVLTLFCVLVFLYALNLPFQLWPTNFSWAGLVSFR